MDNALVSIIIPTYGRSEWLLNALNSVINQTYKNLEVIVVDDNGFGSKNQINTYDSIKELIKEEQRIKYIPHQKNKNGSAARNTGIINANGEFICFLDDDDEFYPEKVEKQLNFFSSHDENWVACYCGHHKYFINKSKKNYSYISDTQGDIRKQVLLFEIDACSGSSLMVRKEIALKINGFDENLTRYQDYNFFARLAFEGYIGVIKEPHVKINIHDGSYRQKSFFDYEVTCKDYLNSIQSLLDQLPIDLKEDIYFVNYYLLLKKALVNKNIKKTLKYFLIIRKPIKTIGSLWKDIKRRMVF